VTGNTVWKRNSWTRSKSCWRIDEEIRHCWGRSSGHGLCRHASWQVLEVPTYGLLETIGIHYAFKLNPVHRNW